MKYGIDYRADLEGLRAIAILLVVAAHAKLPGWQGGFIGVDVFLVLSGYLISGLLWREIQGTGRIDLLGFYVRRIKRLAPALLVMLLSVGLVASVVLSPSRQMDQVDAASAAALWMSNFYFAFAEMDYFQAGSAENLFLHTWSLAVEEQFYLIWPIFLLLLGSVARGRPQWSPTVVRAWGVGFVFVLGFAGCLVLTELAPRLGFYLMPSRIWQFALGAGVWLCLGNGSADRMAVGGKGFVALLGWAGLALILGAALLLGPDAPYPGWRALIPSLGAAACIASGALLGRSGGVSRFLAIKPLQLLGKISYSWYLWHWPVLLIGQALVPEASVSDRLLLVLESLLLAIGSYRWLEWPIRHHRSWLLHPKRMCQLSVMAMLGVTAIVFNWGALISREMDRPEVVLRNAARMDVPDIYRLGCDDWYHSASVKECSFGPSSASHVVVVVGDSIGAQWMPAIRKVYDRPDWRVVVYTKSSCPILDKPIFYPRIGRMYVECDEWRRDVLARVEQMKPDVVILGSAATYDFTAEEWRQGFASVWAQVSRAAGQIYVLRATPSLPFDGPQCLEGSGLGVWLTTSERCSASVTNAGTERVFDIQRQVARQFGNLRLVDLNASICPNGECRAEQDGYVVFRDTQHLTATFVSKLAPALEQFVH